jgi:membrane fusion protein, peptide pheromone/bacteriocin exporter
VLIINSVNKMEIIPFSLSMYSLETYLVKISTRSRIIYWLLIGMTGFVIGILPFIYIDVSVQAPGYFQSKLERQIVYTPLQGKIVFSSIHNGDHVMRGDTLLIIDSESIRAQKIALIKKIAENKASIIDLEKLTNTDFIENQLSLEQLITKRYQAEFANLRNKHNIQSQKYSKKRAEHERNEQLYNQDIIPKTDYENSVFALSSERENLSQIILFQKSLWQSDLSIRMNDAINMIASLEQCTEGINNRIVLAPTSGEVIQSADIQTGIVISQGQNIAEISPDGELVATCFVNPSDIGLIKENQKVKIQVDAFNYNEWGMLQGEIIDISDDMIIENGSAAYFRIKCKPEKTFLSLKNGHKAFIKKGMSVNARIIVIRRSLYHLLFDKADKWFNPYTYNKE